MSYAQPPPNPRRRALTAVGIAGFLLGAVAGCVGGAAGATINSRDTAVPEPAVTVTATPRPGPTVTVTPTPKPAVKVGTGTFIVGDDIQPGRYKARAEGKSQCYWARLRDTDNQLRKIIENNVSAGESRVTIRKGDYKFETSGCTDWVRQ